jgi:RsiW-degrading membrane proteinase PrsW (M82 family)
MNGLLVSSLAGMGPMVFYAWLLYYLDRYEKEPLRLLLGVFLWGAVIAAGSAFMINSITSRGIYLLTQSEQSAQLTVSTLIAPLAEETLKGAAVLLVFLIFRSEFDSPLDGIIYAGITALGFAATENIWYIHQFGFLQNGYRGIADLTVIRSLLIGWQHPFYTAFIGLGLALSRNAQRTAGEWLFPLLGWLFAIAFHLSHNLLASLTSSQGYFGLIAIWDWSGYVGLMALILALIKREQSWMREYLSEEVEGGLINPNQFRTACSAARQTFTYLKSLIRGNYDLERRFFQGCGNLMHKKRQLSKNGDHLEVIFEIQRLRSEIGMLSAALQE